MIHDIFLVVIPARGPKFFFSESPCQQCSYLVRRRVSALDEQRVKLSKGLQDDAVAAFVEATTSQGKKRTLILNRCGASSTIYNI